MHATHYLGLHAPHLVDSILENPALSLLGLENPIQDINSTEFVNPQNSNDENNLIHELGVISIAKNANLPLSMQLNIAKNSDNTGILAGLSDNKSLHPDVADLLSNRFDINNKNNNKHMYNNHILATNPNISNNILVKYIKSLENGGTPSIIANTKIKDPEMIDSIIDANREFYRKNTTRKNHYEALLNHAIENPNTSPGTIEKIYNQVGKEDIPTKYLDNKNTPVSVLKGIINRIEIDPERTPDLFNYFKTSIYNHPSATKEVKDLFNLRYPGH